METDPINLKENRLIGKTDYSFVEFMDSNVKFDAEKKEFKVEKAEYFNAYKEMHPIETKNLTIIIFKKWCDMYASIRNYDIDHRKSNSKCYMKITPRVVQEIKTTEEKSKLIESNPIH